MNIFILDTDPVIAAGYQCDKHVVKMLLESTQLLMNCHESAPYKKAHYNHPCAKWVRENSSNYKWLEKHADALAQEYFIRYNRVHACSAHLEWMKNQNLSLKHEDLTKFQICMPDVYKIDDDPVLSYRNYYNKDKSRFAKWKNGNIPFWFVNEYKK